MNKDELWIDPFDSNIFGFPVCKMYIPSILSLENNYIDYSEFLSIEKAKFIFCSVEFNSVNIRFLENEGYRFAGTRLTYKFEQNQLVNVNISNEFEIVSGLEYSLNLADENINNIIDVMLSTSSYYKNLDISHKVGRALYEKWLWNTFNGYAEEVFVILKNKKIVGLLSLKSRQAGLFIDLLGIHSHYFKNRFGTLLLTRAIEYAQNCSKPLFVRFSGENLPANRLYQKMGFIINSFNFIYHKQLFAD